jgi:hypothetical protein
MSTGFARLDPRTFEKEVLEALPPGDGLIEMRWARGGYSTWRRIPDGVCCWHVNRSSVELTVLSAKADAEETANALLRPFGRFGRKYEAKATGAMVDFNYLNGHGVETVSQFLKCPNWDDIRCNYPEKVRGGIQSLIGMQRPWEAGRLIIFQGIQGSGKTYALRALLMAWRDRFIPVVVTDPERFASEPGYYQGMVGSARPMGHLAGFECADDPQPDLRALIILEDAADLVLLESRSRHSDKVGKMLNMTDGLFGQGREDVFLITFNERIDSIDPAFLRPGRCLAHVEFKAFSREDGKAWLESHGCDPSAVNDEVTLAQLYSLLRNGGRMPAASEIGMSASQCMAAGFACAQSDDP